VHQVVVKEFGVDQERQFAIMQIHILLTSLAI